MGAEFDGVSVREARQIRDRQWSETQEETLLVDCETVHGEVGSVNQFTTGGESNGRS